MNSIVSDGTTVPAEKVIRTSKEQICALLGIDIDKKTIVSILKKQGFGVKSEGKTLVCTVPLVREDVDDYPDLAEDVMRFYGYDKIVSTHNENTHQTFGGKSTHDKNIDTLKDTLRACGVSEILNYSFISPDAADKLLLNADDALRNEIQIKNPLSRDISVMRTQLVSSMLASVSRNVLRKNDAMSFFELGKAFIAEKLPLDTLPSERDILCIGLCNDGDFYTVKSIVERAVGKFCAYALTPATAAYLHPKQALHLSGDGVYGDFGKVHPLVCENFDLPNNVFVAQLDVTDMLNKPIAPSKFKPISKLHPVDRDLAVLVKKSTAVGDMLKAVEAMDESIAEVKLFDIYEGAQIPEGYKSVAFSVKIQPQTVTLSDGVIKNLMDRIITMLSNDFGGRLR